MSSSYDQLVTALYQASHESFIAERKRLAAELKASGDKVGAVALAKLGRPTLSAWAVNQLWWHARATFDELFQTADQLREGNLAASGAHRQAVSKLTAAAQKLLTDSGHGSGDGTLRRVTMTLTGLAASGGFAPEAPGALVKDRDPPGFEAFGIASMDADARATASESAPKASAKQATTKLERAAENDAVRERVAVAEAERRAAEAERARKMADAERARRAEERTRREAKRRELEGGVRDAKAELTTRERARDRIAEQLSSAERFVTRARVELERAEQRLATLDD